MSESANLEKSYQEIKEIGLPVMDISSSGRVDYFRSLMAAKQTIDE